MQGNPELKAWTRGSVTVIGTSAENVCASMSDGSLGRTELADELVLRYNLHKELVEALHDIHFGAVGDPIRYGEIREQARAALARAGFADAGRVGAEPPPSVTAESVLRICVNALRPFAGYACDEPHVGESDCHNCAARAAIARVDERMRLRAAVSWDPEVSA